MTKTISNIPEIFGAIISNSNDNPSQFIEKNLNEENADVTFKAVQNTATTMHLTLPFYEGIRRDPPLTIDDEALNISGGIHVPPVEMSPRQLAFIRHMEETAIKNGWIVFPTED